MRENECTTHTEEASCYVTSIVTKLSGTRTVIGCNSEKSFMTPKGQILKDETLRFKTERGNISFSALFLWGKTGNYIRIIMILEVAYLQAEELLIITNNPLIKENYDVEQCWVEGDCKEVIMQAYNLVALGHQLISHPLAGSIKPNQNPFRSILIAKVPGEVDVSALKLVGNCLRKAEEFMENKIQIDLKTAFKQDLQLVDQYLLLSAIESIKEGR